MMSMRLSIRRIVRYQSICEGKVRYMARDYRVVTHLRSEEPCPGSPSIVCVATLLHLLRPGLPWPHHPRFDVCVGVVQ